MAYNIVRKADNNNVFFYNSADGSFVKALSSNAQSVKAITTDAVEIDYGGEIEIIHASAINQTQVEPDPAVAFSGTAQDLAELLSTDFFFEEVAGGGGGGATGIIGIADATGTYTYYTDINSATTAASIGDTIEFFANITETGTVSWALKAGVNYNMNGYTYTLDEATGTNVLDTSGVTTNGEVHFWNGRIKRTGSLAVGGNNTNIVLSTNAQMTLYFNDCVLESNNGKVLKLSGLTQVVGGTYISQYVGTGTTSMGTFDISGGGAIVRNATILSKSALAIRGFGNCKFFNCNVYSQNYIAVGGYNAALELHSCNVHSDGNVTLGGNNGLYVNTTAISTANSAFDVGGILIGCTGYSLTTFGIRLANSNNQCISSTGYSKPNYGISVNSGAAKLRGCFGKSETGSGCLAGGVTSGCTFEGGTLNGNCHAVTAFAGGGVDIVGCTLIVLNTGANAIGALTNPQNVTYGNNTIVGNPITPISANVVQQQTTTSDSFGNLIVD